MRNYECSECGALNRVPEVQVIRAERVEIEMSEQGGLIRWGGRTIPLGRSSSAHWPANLLETKSARCGEGCDADCNCTSAENTQPSIKE